MSIASSKGSPVILMTDNVNSPIRALELGTIIMNGQTFTFRVWNNLAVSPGVPRAGDVKLVLKASPKSGHAILLASDTAIRGKCTFSAKLQADPADLFHAFPMDDTDYDEIGSGQYNEYQVVLDATQLSDAHKNILKDKEWKPYIVAEFVSLGLELVF